MKKINIWKRSVFGVASLSLLVAAIVLSVGFHQIVYAAEIKQPAQRTFKSPEDAVQSLINALRQNDTKELLVIFGSQGGKIISSVDKVADKIERENFVNAYEEMNKLKYETDKKVILVIGATEFPFAVPIVKKNGNWIFDSKAGKEEVVNRRIGRNELNTIKTCLAYVDAQREYATEDRDGDNKFDYAQKFLSSPGKKDGLYYKTREGYEASPLGPFIAQAASEGYAPKKPGAKHLPYHGYIYKILKRQGKNAPGGAYEYVIRGRMIGGFALVAYPADYGASGVMTFIVNHDGVVYQKDLGKKTGHIAGAMTQYNPDKTWMKIEDISSKNQEVPDKEEKKSN